MGYGRPAALGVQVALPKEKVICIAGDASILMNIQELGTIAQYNLPTKIVIINNQWQGMVRQWQESFYEERYSASEMLLGMPDFIALAVLICLDPSLVQTEATKPNLVSLAMLIASSSSSKGITT